MLSSFRQCCGSFRLLRTHRGALPAWLSQQCTSSAHLICLLCRTCPVFNGTCVPQNKDGTNAAPIHIGTGWGGPTDAGNVPVDQQGRWVCPPAPAVQLPP